LKKSSFKLPPSSGAPTKMNDRYEWFLEKATEIGIHEITPIVIDQSEK
jgi:16S rRNA (uracil1498-N3)-methyltransferase